MTNWHLYGVRLLVTDTSGANSIHSFAIPPTLNSSESLWPPPFSTGVYRYEEPPPEGQRYKEISLSQFISSLFEGVGRLLPGYFADLLICRPSSSQLGTHVAKRCRIGFLEVNRVPHFTSPYFLNQSSNFKIGFKMNL